MTGNEPNLKLQPGIKQKVTFLRQPTSYRESTSSVDVVESHMAWVFLTDHFAYKLKKPVKNSFRDFSTAEARKLDSILEVKLNRRLATNVYHGVVPLLLDNDNQFQLGDCFDHDKLSFESEHVVDWLVKMRRLPGDRMLDTAIEHKTVDAKAIQQVGMLLANFYRSAVPVAASATDYVERMLSEIEGNRHELCKPRFKMPGKMVDNLASAQIQFVNKNSDLLRNRVANGRIIEAHGDLRPEHICLESPPVIIDCLEFNKELRTLDAASDLSFLILECERLGAAEIGRELRKIYTIQTFDRPGNALWNFYQSHQAMSRSKIAIWHLDDPGVVSTQKWIDKARHYLEMAAEFTPATHH